MMNRLFMVFLPFLMSCGGASGPSGFSDHSFGETTEKICYTDSSETCFGLRTINADEFGYEKPAGNLDPTQYRKPVRAIKLIDVDLSVKLAPNFRAIELMSPEKGPIGIFSSLVVGHLQTIRDIIDQALQVNSGYRPPSYNEGLPGAAKWSRHMYGDAVDIVSPGIALDGLANVCLEEGATFTQLYKNHVHCDWRHETLAEEFFGSVLLPKKEMKAGILADLRGKASLSLSGEIVVGSQITIESTLTEQEDPNEKLLRQWTIVYPDGHSEEYVQDNVQIVLVAGTYVIKHVLGGNIYLEKSFDVP